MQESKKPSFVHKIKNHLKQKSLEQYHDEFEKILSNFTKTVTEKEKIKKIITDLVIGVFYNKDEGQQLESYLDHVRAVFINSLGNEKTDLFVDYFRTKINKSIFFVVENNEQAIKEIFQEAIIETQHEVCMQSPSHRKASFVAYMRLQPTSHTFQENDAEKVKKIRRQLHQKLTVWAEIEDKKIPQIVLIATEIKDNQFLPTLLKWSWFTVLLMTIVTRVYDDNRRAVNDVIWLRDYSPTANITQWLAPFIMLLITGYFLLNGQYITKKISGNIQKRIAQLMGEKIVIDWDKAANPTYFPVVIQRTWSTEPFAPPNSVLPGTSGDTYRRLHGIMPAQSQPASSNNAANDNKDSATESKKEVKNIGPDDLITAQGAHYRGVFNQGRFALAKLLPSDAHIKQFEEGYKRKISTSRGRHNTPGVVIFPSPKKGWHAELLPTGNLEGRILATLTKEQDGTSTLNFRHYQATHDVRKWPNAPSPLPPGYDGLEEEDESPRYKYGTS